MTLQDRLPGTGFATDSDISDYVPSIFEDFRYLFFSGRRLSCGAVLRYPNQCLLHLSWEGRQENWLWEHCVGNTYKFRTSHAKRDRQESRMLQIHQRTKFVYRRVQENAPSFGLASLHTNTWDLWLRWIAWMLNPEIDVQLEAQNLRSGECYQQARTAGKLQVGHSDRALWIVFKIQILSYFYRSYSWIGLCLQGISSVAFFRKAGWRCSFLVCYNLQTTSCTPRPFIMYIFDLWE